MLKPSVISGDFMKPGVGGGKRSHVGKNILFSISFQMRLRNLQQDLAFKAGAQNNSQRSFVALGSEEMLQ